ncbi:hypothetical protein [uncultured Flavobacterium sp.]|uniref:hypothetical protein n=1 Tax=uncultured Flavobacterium sp. TaxID=165435 RepID=UPI0030EF5A0D|tara:strand:- start:71540 stop:71893 length:354 start_codon:yes stop_codon:yes gene_type:complete
MVKKFIFKNKHFIVLFTCFTFLLFRYFYDDDKRHHDLKELAYENILKETIPEGFVISKFTDTTYGARNATIINVGGLNYNVNESIYNKINIGDKIKKEINSDKIYINNKEYEYYFAN